MTFLDKLKQENPEIPLEIIQQIINADCPDDWGYEDTSECSDGLGEVCTECWNREMPSTEPTCAEVKAAYDKGLEDAWELAKQILYGNKKQIAEIFNVKSVHVSLSQKREIINCHTPQEAKAKIDEWRESKQIEVGDVVQFIDEKFVVARIDKDENSIVGFNNNGSGFVCGFEKVKKTGVHIDTIQSILDQIGGE